MMAESRHGIGSAIMHFAHNAGRTLKGNQIVRNSLLLFAGSVIIGALFCIIKQYANAYNCGSVVWDYVCLLFLKLKVLLKRKRRRWLRRGG